MSLLRKRLAAAAALSAALILAGCERGPDTTAGADEPAAPPPAEAWPTPEEDEAALAEERAQLDAREAEMAERKAALERHEEEIARQRRDAAIAEREAELRRREAILAARERAERERADRQPEAVTDPAPEEETPVLADAGPGAQPELPGEAEDLAEPEPRRETVALTVPAGALLTVEFLDGVGSAESTPGDAFRARVTQDVEVDGLVAIPAGSLIRGEVTEAVPLKKVGGKARLALDFRRLELPSGEGVPIAASFAEAGRSETKRDAATIGGAAAGGAVLGRILAGDKDKKKGTVLGAIIGAAAGTAIASKTEGEEVTIPRGTLVELTLDEWVRVMAER